ncbi:MAG TPA: hypothetical protein VGQ05_08365 [Streptosporangiaceae bacterium]|nr:hypothetical protein [Streptosporangiaceae bacterium]
MLVRRLNRAPSAGPLTSGGPGYLIAEMLDRQPAGVQQMLLRTSILDRVNGEQIRRPHMRRITVPAPAGHRVDRPALTIRAASGGRDNGSGSLP